MINRVIFEGKVYYKVADLAELFEVSLYKMRKIVKAQEIGTTLKGFGRCVFVLESNVAKIEVRNEVKILETKFTVDPVKKVKTVKTPVIDVKKSKKSIKEAEKKNADNVVEFSKERNEKPTESNNNEVEKLQEEHEQLLKNAKALGVKFAKGEQMPILHEICDKHMGKGNLLKDSTLEDIEKVRSTVAELKIAVAGLNEPLSEPNETELSF